MIPRTFKFATALLLTTCLANVAIAQSAPVITHIELGQAGIARYTMTTQTTGNRISFEVPEAASSDVLASLVLRDPAGGVVDVQTDTPGSIGQSLRGSGFEHGLPTDTYSLLSALTGETVTLKTTTGITTGRMMGLGQVEIAAGDDTVTRSTALLLTVTGVSEVVLTPGTKVDFSEETARQLADAMTAADRKDHLRRFDVTLDSQQARAIDLSYVTEAAAWKNSWRLLLDEGRLQGWATLENASGQDWNDVAMTLTTGAPVAYRRDLINPRYLARSHAPDTGPVPIAVEADSGASFGLMSLPGLPSKSSPPALPSGTALAAEQRQSNGILRYELPEAIDLKNGRTANLMYLDLPIEPKIRGFFRPGQHENGVLLAASISAQQPLTSGLVSVQDSRGFVGDAPFNGMLAGQSRLLPFASAGASKVLHKATESLHLTNLVYLGGALVIEVVRTRTTTYTTNLPERVELFSVDHPAAFGELEGSNGQAEIGAGFYRITVPAEDGQGGVSLTEKETATRNVTIGKGDFASILSDVQSGRIKVNAEYRAAFVQAEEIRLKFQTLSHEMASTKRRYETLLGEQERLRENLRTVNQTALRNRYLGALDETETQIGETFDVIDLLEEEQGKLQADLLALFASL